MNDVTIAASFMIIRNWGIISFFTEIYYEVLFLSFMVHWFGSVQMMCVRIPGVETKLNNHNTNYVIIINFFVGHAKCGAFIFLTYFM